MSVEGTVFGELERKRGKTDLVHVVSVNLFRISAKLFRVCFQVLRFKPCSDAEE